MRDDTSRSDILGFTFIRSWSNSFRATGRSLSERNVGGMVPQGDGERNGWLKILSYSRAGARLAPPILSHLLFTRPDN